MLHNFLRESTFSLNITIRARGLRARTLDSADIEGWIVAETEGCKVADRTLERAGKLPTFFFLIAVGWKVADTDFVCSSEG